MSLVERINNNPYLKVSNCTDISDIESAMDDLRKLQVEFGENNKTLLELWKKFSDKTKKLEIKNIQAVTVPLDVIKQVLKYCEDEQIYDKLGTYKNFYYKLNQIRREYEDGDTY